MAERRQTIPPEVSSKVGSVRRRAPGLSRFAFRGIPHAFLAGLVAFGIQWVHGRAPAFLYDAAQYWGGAAAMIAGKSPLVPGGLTTRGVFTAFVYLPPAFVTGLSEPKAAVWTVLAWNALLGAVVSVVLIPRIAGLFSSHPLAPPRATQIWVSALLGGFLLSGFARFPLVDVWAAALALAGFYGLVVGRRWWWLSLAGASLTVASNLRPAMIAPVLLAVLVLLLVRARPIVIAAPAAALAASPQVLFNVLEWGLWSPVPHDTIPLSVVQAGPAPYTIRYDTVAFADQAPQQWYCDPHYAALLAHDTKPSNQLEVIASAFRHLPDSLWFLVRKAAAGLQWSLATPYGNPPVEATDPMGFVILIVSVFGLAALILRAVRVRSDRPALVTTLAMLGFWFGALATIVFSTPETRFALPLVLVGLIGTVSAAPQWLDLRAPSRSGLVTTGCALLVAVGLFLAGAEALGYHMPPGPLTDAAACSRQ